MPKVLLLDEIAGGLTESECGELIQTIKALHAAGTTIVWIEHVVHALLAVVERLVVINFGQKLDDGRPEAVLRNPAVQDVYMGMTAA
jgi:branched-chain amino acid transport system ATP-binding protein